MDKPAMTINTPANGKNQSSTLISRPQMLQNTSSGSTTVKFARMIPLVMVSGRA